MGCYPFTEKTMREATFPELYFRILDEADITDEIDRSIRASLVECYPKNREHFSRMRWWHSHQSWTVMAVESGGEVAAGLSIVERCIQVGEKGLSLNIAGVGNVFALPRWRKKGVIDQIMILALKEARKRGLEAGLLFCIPPLEKVYRRMGWKKINTTVTMHDESGFDIPVPEKNIIMVVPITIETFPDGEIHLMGRDW